MVSKVKKVRSITEWLWSQSLESLAKDSVYGCDLERVTLPSEPQSLMLKTGRAVAASVTENLLLPEVVPDILYVGTHLILRTILSQRYFSTLLLSFCRWKWGTERKQLVHSHTADMWWQGVSNQVTLSLEATCSIPETYWLLQVILQKVVSED